MKSIILAVLIAYPSFSADAQIKRPVTEINKKTRSAKSLPGSLASVVVVDERLAVLRVAPSLYSRPIQRMRRGRILTVTGDKLSDGVNFYHVMLPAKTDGWVQAEAVVKRNKSDHEGRMARLVEASEGFEQIERAVLFLVNFPNSQFRPGILLLVGDLVEEQSIKLSNEARRRLDRREMAATGAPLHSFYLNYAGLDRFRKLDIGFLFDPGNQQFHYDGAAWKVIIQRFANSPERAEAQKRLDSLREKMAPTGMRRP